MKIRPQNAVSAPLPISTSAAPFIRAALISALIIIAVGLYLAVEGRESFTSQAVGNAAIFVAAVFSGIVCLRAARRGRDDRKAWLAMSLSWFVGALGQILFTVTVTPGNASTPALNTLSYLGYSVPVIVALFLFPKPPALLISRFRSILDVLVITIGLIFISEATVLHAVWEQGGLQTVAGWSGLAYPIADLAICSVVFTLGMRQPPQTRLMWLCLGTGLVILAVTDTIYAHLLALGQTNLTATPLVIGWMAAPVMTALATMLPRREPKAKAKARDLSLPAQLIPYVPVVGAVVVLATGALAGDSFLLAAGVALLVVVMVRQVMIVYENVSLTRDLEAKVAARTVELTTLGSIVTSSTDAIVGMSLDGVITAWNPAAEQLLGYRAADTIGNPPRFLTPDAHEEVKALLVRARDGHVLGGYEVDWPRPDGTTVPVALGVSPIHDGDLVRGISIIGQDITERRRTAAALVKAREEAMESSRLKSEFLATMSHEIRTPMNGVIGLTSLLLDTELDNSQRQYADGVQAAGEALLSVINDILDFSKLDAGKVVLDIADFDPRRLVEDVGALLAPVAFSKKLELVAYCLPDVPGTVRGDRGRIRQILLNLASNAVKFTSEGEVAISVKSVPLADGEITLRFEVTDSGIGVAAEDRDRLFESFSQADASTTRRFGGTGLGLAICRRLVEVMGGHLGMESELGVGSSFWFELPLPLGNTPEILGTPTHDLLKGLRVLVVDDNATNRSILEVQLKTWHLQPDQVDSGPAALDRLRETALRGDPYDIAVLDMFMPGMDGLQLAQAISSDPLLKGIPMIMLTSSMQLDPTALREAGIGQWLTKPMRSMELYDRLMRLMAVAEPEAGVERPVRRPQPATNGPQSSLGRILVVEDNSLNQLVAEGILSRLGYEVRSVVNGVEALEAVESSRYAAVLMDCHMPVMDGFTATAEIRRRPSNGFRIPIIAMTAGALVEDRERCLAVGMDDYISKPVNLQTLETVLARWIKPAVPVGGAANGSESSTPPPIDDRPPIDESRLEGLRDLEAADGSSILASILSAFTGHSADLLVSIQEAAQAGDNDRLQGIAHELRGASATAGATHVAKICAEIELAARRGGPAPSPELLDDLGREFERAKSALARMVFAPSPLALS